MSEIIIEKYVVEITRYPNGTSYQKIYPIGKPQAVRREDAAKKKVEAQKKLEELREENSYKTVGRRMI